MKIDEGPRYYFLLLLLPVSAWANEFTMFDCKQMFHNKHPCNKQELLAYRWHMTTCDRIESQEELHTYRTCLGHAGIRIQEICNVCSFFTYPMICSKAKSKRLLRCLGDQFLIQGHGEEAIVAARLCGNMVRAHGTSTTMTTQSFQPNQSNHKTTTPIPIEDVRNVPYHPQNGPLGSDNVLVQPRSSQSSSAAEPPTPKTQFFRSASKDVLKEDRRSNKESQLKQRPIHSGRPIPPPALKNKDNGRSVDNEDDHDDTSIEADAQEKILHKKVQPTVLQRLPPSMSVPTVADQIEKPMDVGTSVKESRPISERTANPRYNIPAFPVRQQLPAPSLEGAKKREPSQVYHTVAPNLQFV